VRYRVEEKRHCSALVISEADWLSTAHPDCAVVMPSAGTLGRKLCCVEPEGCTVLAHGEVPYEEWRHRMKSRNLFSRRVHAGTSCRRLLVLSLSHTSASALRECLHLARAALHGVTSVPSRWDVEACTDSGSAGSVSAKTQVIASPEGP
jgi:hypothetical protein